MTLKSTNKQLKNELNQFSDASTQVAIALDKVIDRLEHVLTSQDKIVDKLSNGMITDIVNGVTNNYNQIHKETIETLNRLNGGCTEHRKLLQENEKTFKEDLRESLDNSSIAKDINHTKWFIGIVAILVLVVSFILRGLDNRASESQNIKDLIKMMSVEKGTAK